jgi:hypothetical protein
MPRRRSSVVPVSFFSFQDLLLCLIGIAIVIAMTLVLQVTNAAVQAVNAAAERSDVTIPLDERERALRERVAVLVAALKEAAQRPDVDPLAERTSLRRELLLKAGELEALEIRAETLENQLRELLVENPGAAELREYLELVRIRDGLAAQLQAMEQRKEISFIIDRTETVRPIVMELSSGRIVVTDINAGVPYRIAAGTEEAQCNQALRLYDRLRDGQPAYVLMIVTPSGIPMYSKLYSAILALPEVTRPRVGLDLIPEGSFVARQFPGRAEGAR